MKQITPCKNRRTTMTTFTNDFHNTEISTRANLDETVTAATYRRVINKLCGIRECQCDPFRASEYRLVPADDRGRGYRVVFNR